MSTSVTTSDSISSITGYKAIAVARIGSNGDLDSNDWEYMVGGASGSSISTGRKTWMADPTDTIICDDTAVEWVAKPGGGSNGVVWTVAQGGTVPLNSSAASYGNINYVKVRAMVTETACCFSWNSIIVKFYKNGTLIETLSYSAAVADTTDEEQSCGEQIVTFTPTQTDNDKVVVTALLNIAYPSPWVNTPDGVMGQFFLFAA